MLERSKEFQVLASHLNFTTAARELSVSQPALSRHMGELEQMLGFKLLERSPVKLTPAGSHFLEGIGLAMGQIDALIEECRQLARLKTCELTIAMVHGTDPLSQIMYGSLARMFDTYPNFSYQFKENRKATIEQQVFSRAVDVGVVYFDCGEIPPGFTLEWLYDEPFCAWVHESNPVAPGPVDFSEMSSCVLLLSANRNFQTWADGMRHACRKYGSTPSFKTKELNSINDYLISLQGNEVVFGCSSSDNPSHLNPRLRKVEFTNRPKPTYPVYLLYRSAEPNPVLEQFLANLRELSAHKRTDPEQR